MSNSSQDRVIRTPDQRLRVFVSSTLQELIEERVGAREAITALRLSPVMFEMGARPHPPRDLYRAYLEQSDIFIGIYWQRYGWIAPDMEISGLEDEYRHSGDKPKLIYIKAAAPEREPRLKELLDRLESDGVSYKPFSTAAELRGLIQDDLAMLLTERFDQGRGPRTSAVASPSELPTGAVTFLLSDIEGSTQLASALRSDYSELLQAQRAILRDACGKHRGREIRAEGDSSFVVFASPKDALAAAVEGQLGLSAYHWPEGAPVRVRMGLHTGEASTTGAGYEGIEVNRAARIAAAAHGGQVLMSGSTWALLKDDRPTGVALRDLGEHRLKDFPGPEHIYQVAIDGLPADFPALRALAATPSNPLNATPNNLVTQLTRFIGRERDLEETRARLLNARLVTISGGGGLGKTRLSIELATTVSQVFNAGVWFIELAGLSDGSLVPHAVATVVGVRESANEPLEATLSRHLGSLRALIVLDNCEHLVEGCAQLVQVLLQRCPVLTVLATSREVLEVPGEVVWRLSPLALPEAARSDAVEELLRSEAVALFVDRATLADPSFRLDQQNAARVVGICSRLDGIPLALELAAARISVMSLEDLASRLEDRFRALRSGSRTANPRQQTLRATIDWSHELLTDVERVLFRRLSVFAGGFGLEAAEAVCADADLEKLDVVDVLSRLVDKSLVLSGDRSGGRTRYRILETIRQYAGERLREAGESSGIQRHHAEYYLQLAEEGDGALRGRGQSEWLRRLDQELDNFRAALAWAQEEDPGLGLRLAADLVGYWFTRGVVREGRDWLDRFLAACAADTPCRLKAMNGAGLLASVQGAIEDARRLLQQSIELSEAGHDLQSLATGLSYLGRMEAVGSIGSGISGREHLQKAISLSRELGDRPGEGFSLGYLGYIEYYAFGDLIRGAELLQQSVDLLVELGDRLTSLRLILGLGLIALEKGDVGEARHRWSEALALSSELRDTWTIGLYLECFSALAAHESQAERAMTLSGAAEMVRSRYGVACPPPLRAKIEQWVEPVRDELGTRSERAVARGRSMSLDAAIAFALEERSPNT
jgi:predicted ATPase/class 3 adenylate cyclase